MNVQYEKALLGHRTGTTPCQLQHQRCPTRPKGLPAGTGLNQDQPRNSSLRFCVSQEAGVDMTRGEVVKLQ